MNFKEYLSKNESQVAIYDQKEYHKLTLNPDNLLDLSKLLASMKEKASKITEQVYGKKFMVIIDGERYEFDNINSIQKFLISSGLDDGITLRVFKNGNKQIVADFDNTDNAESLFRL